MFLAHNPHQPQPAPAVLVGMDGNTGSCLVMDQAIGLPGTVLSTLTSNGSQDFGWETFPAPPGDAGGGAGLPASKAGALSGSSLPHNPFSVSNIGRALGG